MDPEKQKIRRVMNKFFRWLKSFVGGDNVPAAHPRSFIGLDGKFVRASNGVIGFRLEHPSSLVGTINACMIQDDGAIDVEACDQKWFAESLKKAEEANNNIQRDIDNLPDFDLENGVVLTRTTLESLAALMEAADDPIIVLSVAPPCKPGGVARAAFQLISGGKEMGRGVIAGVLAR